MELGLGLLGLGFEFGLGKVEFGVEIRHSKIRDWLALGLKQVLWELSFE